SRTAGLVVSTVLIVVCALCAGWALRLAIFGGVIAWDLLRTIVLAWKRVPHADSGIRCFYIGRGLALKKRTLGRLILSDKHELQFCCRRFILGPSWKMLLPDKRRYEIGRGLLYPQLIETEPTAGNYRVLFGMLPSYAGSEEALREQLGLQRVAD